jgi:UDP-N-acetylglucosamine:LPS N-acetylglucosamine transferase
MSRHVGTRTDLLLVCSSGGHLLELLALEDAWRDLDRAWVSFDRGDTRYLLRNERVIFAHGPTNRSVRNLLRNLKLAWRVVRQVRPRALITTGAGVAVPFVWVAHLCGVRTVYVESLTRIDRASLSLRLIQPALSRTYVQWPDLTSRVRRSHYAGTVFGSFQ